VVTLSVPRSYSDGAFKVQFTSRLRPVLTKRTGRGLFSHYFFNDAEYEVREDYSRKSSGIDWSLRRVRNSQTNAVTDLRLSCGDSQIKLPIKLDGTLEKAKLMYPIFRVSAPRWRTTADRKPMPGLPVESKAVANRGALIGATLLQT